MLDPYEGFRWKLKMWWEEFLYWFRKWERWWFCLDREPTLAVVIDLADYRRKRGLS